MSIVDINMDDLWEDLHGLVGDEGYDEWDDSDFDEEDTEPDYSYRTNPKFLELMATLDAINQGLITE